MAPHPRDVFRLDHAEEAEGAWLDTLARGRMHHAWLLTGPEGVGKATFAYRAARRLLGARPDDRYGLLGSDPEHPVSRQVSARSHPDLMVIQREDEDGKARKSIPVDEARKLPEFFSMSPASSPWRVALIDAADDLNPNAANAVLKTLEEPPPRWVLFLVCHAPGKLLPTIRSRCRRLVFRPWPEEAVADFLGGQGEADPDTARRLAAMAKGSPGKAMALGAAKALELDRAALELLRSLPKVDETALLALSLELRGAEGQARLALLFERLAEHVRTMVEDSVGREGASPSPPWFDAWDKLTGLAAEAELLNLDRQDVFWTAVAALREAARA